MRCLKSALEKTQYSEGAIGMREAWSGPPEALAAAEAFHAEAGYDPPYIPAALRPKPQQLVGRPGVAPGELVYFAAHTDLMVLLP